MGKGEKEGKDGNGNIEGNSGILKFGGVPEDEKLPPPPLEEL